MEIQDKISLILELGVSNILHIIGSNLTAQQKKDLRIQFDAELAWRSGEINCGQHADIQKKHTIT